MKVLMLSQFFAPVLGGEERVVEDLGRELVRRGHDVAVATLRTNGLPEYESRNGVRVYRIDSLGSRAPWLYSDPQRPHVPPAPDPKASLALKRVLARERPDVVHAHNWLVHSFLPLKRWSGAALVMTLHDFSLVCATRRLMYKGTERCGGPGPVRCLVCSSRVYGIAKGVPIALMNWLSGVPERRAVDMFLPISNAVAERNGLASGGLPFRMIPNFLPEAAYERPQHTDPRVADLPAGDFILCAGDLTEDKGTPILLEAHADLEAAPPLVLIGRAYARELSRRQRDVLALGTWPHAALLEAWRRCAVAVVPSVWDEPFGLVALEAMAAGRPVIASDVGGLADVVVGGETGLLVPPGDPAALRAAIGTLLADPELRDRMGRAARRRAEDFRASKIVPLVEQVYEEALRR